MTQPQLAPPLDPDDPGFVPGNVTVEETSAVNAPAQEDYFGFSAEHVWMLPDGVSWMKIRVLNEGAKAEFQKKTQQDVVLERGSGNAKFNIDPSVERHALIIESVIDWHMVRNGVAIPLSTNANNNKRNLQDWLELTNPKLVEDLEEFIRKHNPWLRGEMTVADIDKEMDRLQELRKEVAERERGEDFSSNR